MYLTVWKVYRNKELYTSYDTKKEAIYTANYIDNRHTNDDLEYLYITEYRKVGATITDKWGGRLDEYREKDKNKRMYFVGGKNNG